MRKLLFGAAALVLSCSLASAGEPGLKVDVGMDIHVVESVHSEIENQDLMDYGSLAIATRVSVTKQFAEGWSASLSLRAVMGFEDDDAEVIDEDGEADFSEIDIGGSGGYTIAINEQLSVTPVLGLTWRSYEMEGEPDAGGGTGEVDVGVLTLDFGVRMALRVNDQVAVTGKLMFGLPLAGDAELDAPGLDADADIDGGFLFELGGGVEYRLNETVALFGGLTYESASYDWEWDGNADGEDELDRFAIKLGAVFSF